MLRIPSKRPARPLRIPAAFPRRRPWRPLVRVSRRRVACVLGASLAGHATAFALLLTGSARVPIIACAPPVSVTWLEVAPDAGAFAPAKVESVVPPDATSRREDDLAQVVAATDLAAARVVQPPAAERSRCDESNYWMQVRADVVRHLSWPSRERRPALVMLELSLDERGGLASVVAYTASGGADYAHCVERAAHRAAPFPPPGRAGRSARLPVRFENQKPREISDAR